METFGGILAAILIAVVISAIFYYGFSARGPWGSFWTFFLVLLLIIWAASVWTRPVGPVYWGVAWVPLFFIGLMFALFLAAIPTYDAREDIDETTTDASIIEEGEAADRADLETGRQTGLAAAAAVSWIFWVFIIVLFIAIIFGYT